MSDIKLALGAEQTLTVTNLHSLASSATAGWQSAVVDNTTTLYPEVEVQVVLSFANTAPGASKCAFVYKYEGRATTYTNPASGTEGTITLVDITSAAQNLVLVGTVPYTTQNEVAESALLRFAVGGKWGLVVMNHSGAALNGSGNTVKWSGRYLTV